MVCESICGSHRTICQRILTLLLHRQIWRACWWNWTTTVATWVPLVSVPVVVLCKLVGMSYELLRQLRNWRDGQYVLSHRQFVGGSLSLDLGRGPHLPGC